MSFEDSLFVQVASAVNAVKLDAIVIGNAAAALHGVPIMTQDIDLFVRETPQNKRKIKQLLATLGEHVVASRPFEPVSRMMRIEGLPVDVDIVFELSSHVKFESVHARAVIVTIEGVAIRVASLQDVIDAKQAANRPKDLAVLPMLKQFQQVQKAISEGGDQGS